MTDLDAIRDKVLAAFLVPPVLLGSPPSWTEPDPRCFCRHWGCRTGWWHCYGEMGDCWIPAPPSIGGQ